MTADALDGALREARGAVSIALHLHDKQTSLRRALRAVDRAQRIAAETRVTDTPQQGLSCVDRLTVRRGVENALTELWDVDKSLERPALLEQAWDGVKTARGILRNMREFLGPAPQEPERAPLHAWHKCGPNTWQLRGAYRVLGEVQRYPGEGNRWRPCAGAERLRRSASWHALDDAKRIVEERVT